MISDSDSLKRSYLNLRKSLVFGGQFLLYKKRAQCSKLFYSVFSSEIKIRIIRKMCEVFLLLASYWTRHDRNCLIFISFTPATTIFLLWCWREICFKTGNLFTFWIIWFIKRQVFELWDRIQNVLQPALINTMNFKETENLRVVLL